jgi:hypothetical protein
MRKWFIVSMIIAIVGPIAWVSTSASDILVMRDINLLDGYADSKGYDIERLRFQLGVAKVMSIIDVQIDVAGDSDEAREWLGVRERVMTLENVEVETYAVNDTDKNKKGNVLYRSMVKIASETPFPECEYIRVHVRMMSVANEYADDEQSATSMRMGECGDDYFEIEYVARTYTYDWGPVKLFAPNGMMPLTNF